ncbi:MAG: hypothetical protein AAGC99_17710, partial [Pseudomonadota bacterium]
YLSHWPRGKLFAPSGKVNRCSLRNGKPADTRDAGADGRSPHSLPINPPTCHPHQGLSRAGATDAAQRDCGILLRFGGKHRPERSGNLI